jgi:hypothetical protein
LAGAFANPAGLPLSPFPKALSPLSLCQRTPNSRILHRPYFRNSAGREAWAGQVDRVHVIGEFYAIGEVNGHDQYPWGSVGWFEQTATAAQRRTIYGFRTDQVSVPDDYSVSPDW